MDVPIKAESAHDQAIDAATKAETAYSQALEATSKSEQILSIAEKMQTRLEQVDAKYEESLTKSKPILDWIQHKEAELRQQLHVAEQQIDEKTRHAEEAERIANQWRQEANDWHERILALHSSTSWVITKPLRLIKRIISLDKAYFVNYSPLMKIKRTLHRLIVCILHFAGKRPRMKTRLKAILAHFPSIYQKIQK